MLYTHIRLSRTFERGKGCEAVSSSRFQGRQVSLLSPGPVQQEVSVMVGKLHVLQQDAHYMSKAKAGRSNGCNAGEMNANGHLLL